MAVTANCDDTCVIQIDTKQVSDIYREMSALVYADMDKQYAEGKIHGATYATTYAALMDSVVAGALNAVVAVQSKETAADRCVKMANCDLVKEQENKVKTEIALLKEQLAKVKCETELTCAQRDKVKYEVSDILPTQKALTQRQTKGFKDNLNIKLFEAQMNGWAMMFSSGLLEDKPGIISNKAIDGLYNTIIST